MTTNAGAAEISRASMGFKDQDHSLDGIKIIEKQFSPEFRNRLDAIAQFKSLSKDSVYLIVEKLLAELQGKLNDKKISLQVDKTAREWFVDRGFDKLMGARPMGRLFKDMLKKGKGTEFIIEDIKFDQDIPMRMFSKAVLRK